MTRCDTPFPWTSKERKKELLKRGVSQRVTVKKQACHKRVTSMSQRVAVEKQEIWIAADPSPLPRTRQGSVWDSQGTPGGRRAEKPPPQEWQQRPEPARPGGRPPSSRSPLRRSGCRSWWHRPPHASAGRSPRLRGASRVRPLRALTFPFSDFFAFSEGRGLPGLEASKEEWGQKPPTPFT